MFHRRLLLLMALMALGFAVLGVQTARLTLAQGEEARERAEAKLLTREFHATRRGRILDRHGRVLAQDRPSFDVTVDYRVINGEWSLRQAGRAARRLHGAAEWRQMSPQERQALLDEYIPLFQQHLDSMWRLLAETADVEESRLAMRRSEIIRRVESMAFHILAQRVRSGLGAHLAAGREISLETEEEVRRRMERPVSEQQSPHVVIPQVSDDVSFALMRLTDREVPLEITAADGRSLTVMLPLLPELRVVQTTAREYPHERLRVEVDLSTLPGPMKRDERLPVFVEGVAYHILGRMKDAAQLEDTQRRRARIEEDKAFRERVMTPQDQVSARGGLGLGPRRFDLGAYQDNDPAGLAGVELSREDELRGLRGVSVEHLETGERIPHPPTPGLDVRLTIDVLLQGRIQALMMPEVGLAVAQEWHGQENPTIPVGTPLTGAAVVLDIDTGDILAMVSSPSVPRRLLHEDPESLFKDPLNESVYMPWIDRAVARPYPPGSIAKALMIPAAVQMGRLDLAHTIDCTGHFLPNRTDIFRCWIFHGRWQTTHNAVFGRGLTAPESLMVSCNIYYYTLGQRLGVNGIVRTYEMFGLGEPFDLGVGQEFAGHLGPLGDRRQLRSQDAVLMGIGQGPVAWTPLHAADAYATLARGGIRLRPRLIDDGRRSSHSASESDGPIDLGFDSAAIAEAMQGLYDAVNNTRGTGHHVDVEVNGRSERFRNFTAEGVTVWGKTGTAQAPTITVRRGDPLYDMGLDDTSLPEGVRLLRQGNHSWFVVMAGREDEGRPRYVISVVMEYAGSGGRVSGPIANQIIHALKAEGYL